MFFYRARYYDPQARRFINEDPIGLNGGINLYSYLDDNPISMIDPYGLRGHHIVPEAVWSNLPLSREVKAYLNSETIAAGTHYYYHPEHWDLNRAGFGKLDKGISGNLA